MTRARFSHRLFIAPVLFAGLLAAACLLSSSSFSSTISNVPSDTRIQSYIEELGRRGLLGNLFFSCRPYTRTSVLEGLAALDEAVGAGRVKLSPYEAWLVERLRGEFGVKFAWGYAPVKQEGGARPGGISTVVLGAELETVGKSTENDVTWVEEVGGERHEEKTTKSEGTGRAIFSGWTEVTLPYGLSLSHRFRVDTDVSQDPGFRGRPWRDELGGYVANAYGKLALGPFELLAGRDKLSWGPGKSGSLILSDLAPPMDMVCMRLRFGRVTATGFFTKLDDLTLDRSIPYGADSVYAGDVASRYLSGHRIDARITRNLEVGLSETVVYGGPDRGLEPGYINPLSFYYSEQWNLDKNDNPTWSFDATWWPKQRLQIYGQFLVDDYQFEHKSSGDKEPAEIAFLLGLHSGDPFGLLNTSVNLEYVRVNPWTYNQPLPWNRYVYAGELLGHPLGPDADAIYVSVTRWVNEKFTCEVDYRFARHGETSVWSDWPVPVVGPWRGASFPDGSFPLGTASKSHRVGILAGFHPALHVDVDGFASLESASDYENVGGAKLTSYEVGLSVSLRPEWVIQ